MRALLSRLHVDPYGDLLAVDTAARFKKLLSPKWLVSKAQLTLFEVRHPDYPWITRDAIRLIERYLRPEHVGFEWGSGNGSIWFARRSQRLVSVEHNSAWAAKVRRQFARAGITRIDYRLVPESRYTDVIDEFPDDYFDYIVVDGLFRDVAFLKSIPKIKPAGRIVFDNANWYLPSNSRTPHSRSFADGPSNALFAQVVEQTQAWQVMWTTNGVNDTAIFVKPN